jgi:hypothetical protein
MQTETQNPAPNTSSVGEQSRTVLLAQIQKLGIDTNALEVLTVDQLSDLLFGMNRLSVKHNITTKKANTNSMLSSNDKRILKELIITKGDVSMVSLSRTLQIPLATLLRRRKRLEELLERNYALKFDKFALRQITFLILTEGQNAPTIGKDILNLPGVTKVVRMLSNKVDLRVEAVLKTNEDIVKLSEQIKAIEGVQELFWMDTMVVIGEKNQTSLDVIDSF